MNEYEKRGTIVYYTCIYPSMEFVPDSDRVYYIGGKKHTLELKYALCKRRPYLFQLDENGNFKHDIHITNIKKASLREFLEECHGL